MNRRTVAGKLGGQPAHAAVPAGSRSPDPFQRNDIRRDRDKEETESMNFSTCLLIAAGGALGTLGRYCLSVVALPISQYLPWGTILINTSGSLLIGFFGTLTLASGKFPVSEEVRLFVMVGFCGGFTTFSAFSLQTLDLIRDGSLTRAGANIVLSLVLSIGAVALGHASAAYLNGGAREIAQIAIEEEA